MESTATIYLDNQATTPCDPRVVDAMAPFFSTNFGNPGSLEHSYGQDAALAVRRARIAVATLVGASPKEISFTGSATESNNLAILGVARANTRERNVILTSAIEHRSVLAPIEWLGRHGFETRVLPVDHLGHLELDALDKALNERVLMVSIQAANNEIGTIQRLPQIIERAHRVGALVHCDAVQAVGRIPIDVRALDVDLLSLSAHKLYGPKGVAALYIRRPGGEQAIPIEPLMFGGGQEDGLRPGTLNVPGIVGFGCASEIAFDEGAAESQRVEILRDTFETRLSTLLAHVRFNGDRFSRLPNNSSLTFPGIDAEALIANLRGVALSTGSACRSGALEPSPVLTAIGLNRAEAHQSLRIGLGRSTDLNQVVMTAQRMAEIVDRLIALQSI
jgi:cysteine desulfurase